MVIIILPVQCLRCWQCSGGNDPQSLIFRKKFPPINQDD